MLDNEGAEDTLLALTADIVAAHVSNNSVSVNDLPNLTDVHGRADHLSDNRSDPGRSSNPISDPSRSSAIFCLEDGKREWLNRISDSLSKTPTIPAEWASRNYPMSRPTMPSSGSRVQFIALAPARNTRAQVTGIARAQRRGNPSNGIASLRLP